MNSAPAFPPKGACDCHVHVIGAKRDYPLSPDRVYTPMEAPFEALDALLSRLKLDRVVIVQPSFYGTDNACTLDALDRFGSRARAVAVLDPETSTATLDDMHRRGVRGLRVNVATGGANDDLDITRVRLEAASRLCASNGWHVQTFIPSAAIEPLTPILADLPVPVVIDHFGLIAPGEENGRAADALKRLLQTGRAWVKLSAPYRITEPPWHAMAPLARALAAENADRLVWGSDWPHTPGHGRAAGGREVEEPFQDIDTQALLNVVREWLPDETIQRIVLVDNPAALYGF